MGEAKRRAERRREAREAAAPVDTRKKFTLLTDPLPADLVRQIRMRYEFVSRQFPSFGEFVAALLTAGIEVCDHDVNAVLAHQRGQSRPVDPSAEPERLVLAPDEVPARAAKVLAKLHEANLMGGRP